MPESLLESAARHPVLRAIGGPDAVAVTARRHGRVLVKRQGAHLKVTFLGWGLVHDALFAQSEADALFDCLANGRTVPYAAGYCGALLLGSSNANHKVHPDLIDALT